MTEEQKEPCADPGYYTKTDPQSVKINWANDRGRLITCGDRYDALVEWALDNEKIATKP